MTRTMTTELFVAAALLSGSGCATNESVEPGIECEGKCDGATTLDHANVMALAAGEDAVTVLVSGRILLYDADLQNELELDVGIGVLSPLAADHRAIWQRHRAPLSVVRAQDREDNVTDSIAWTNYLSSFPQPTEIVAGSSVVAYALRIPFQGIGFPDYEVCGIRASDLLVPHCVRPSLAADSLSTWNEFVLFRDTSANGSVAYFRTDPTAMNGWWSPPIRPLAVPAASGTINTLTIGHDRLWIGRGLRRIDTYELALGGSAPVLSAQRSLPTAHTPARMVATETAVFYRFNESYAGAKDGGISRVTVDGTETAIVTGLGRTGFGTSRSVDDFAVVGSRLYFLAAGRVSYVEVSP